MGNICPWQWGLDLDAPVDGGGDDGVLLADHEGADVDDALEVRAEHLAQLLRLQAPDVQLLPDP